MSLLKLQSLNADVKFFTLKIIAGWILFRQGNGRVFECRLAGESFQRWLFTL